MIDLQISLRDSTAWLLGVPEPTALGQIGCASAVSSSVTTAKSWSSFAPREGCISRTAGPYYRPE